MSALIFGLIGQSNMPGQHGPLQQYTLQDCWIVGIDGFTRPLTEPAFDSTNQATGAINHAAVDVNNSQSSVSAFAYRLRQLGETRRLIFVPAALGGTSATQWGQGLADSPPTYSNIYGGLRHGLLVAMQAPGAMLGGIIINQGEADAQVDAPTANAWDTTWGTTMDALLAFATTQGWAWAKVKRFWVDALQLGSSLAFAGQVRTRQFAIAGSRSDTVTNQEPDANPTDLHLYPADQNALGILRANSWFAAT